MFKKSLKKKLANGTATDADFIYWAELGGAEVQALIINRPEAPAAALLELAKRGNDEVYAHPNCDDLVIEQLLFNAMIVSAAAVDDFLTKLPAASSQFDHLLPRAVAQEELFPWRHLTVLAQCQSLDARSYDLIFNMTGAIRSKSVYVEGEAVKAEALHAYKALAANPSITTYVLCELLRNESSQIRKLASIHPSVTKDLLELLPEPERNEAQVAYRIMRESRKLMTGRGVKVSAPESVTVEDPQEIATLTERHEAHASTNKRLIAAQTLALTMMTHLDVPLPVELKAELKNASESTVKLVNFYTDLLDAPCSPQAERAISIARTQVEKAISSYEKVVEALIDLTEASLEGSTIIEDKFESLRASTNAWVTLTAQTA